MDSAYYIVIILGTVIVILEMLKLAYRKKPSGKRVTDIGTCMTVGSRDVQEDAAATMTTAAGVMAVLADGAGKTYGGRIAGRIAVDTCADIFRDYNAFNNPQYYFRKAFHCANREILKAVGDENRGTASAGCVLLREGYLYYALAGNIRICVFRDGSLIPVSTGHTVSVLAEKKFHEGKISRQDAIQLLENHRLYNYLGKDDFKDIEYFDAPVRLKEEDIVVLMSDGVYDLISLREIEHILAKTGSCQQKALAVIEKVNSDTSTDKDNASVVLVGTALSG